MSVATTEALDSEPEWTDAAGVAHFLGDVVPRRTISELGRSGRVPSVKVGTRRLFHLPTIAERLRRAMDDGQSI